MNELFSNLSLFFHIDIQKASGEANGSHTTLEAGLHGIPWQGQETSQSWPTAAQLPSQSDGVAILARQLGDRPLSVKRSIWPNHQPLLIHPDIGGNPVPELQSWGGGHTGLQSRSACPGR
jgi:hypothetical protein